MVVVYPFIGISWTFILLLQENSRRKVAVSNDDIAGFTQFNFDSTGRIDS